MHVLVTGAAGHLGEALMRGLPELGFDVRGLDRVAGPWVDVCASINDQSALRAALDGIGGVIHAATLHKPHVATHRAMQFVETNVAGTLSVLQASAEAGVGSFVMTSTTSAFGRSLVDPGRAVATWIDEHVVSRPKNIYGTTKVAAEDLCDLIHHERGMPVVVLRTSRFFPEADDLPERAAAFDDTNLKVLELLHRRVDISDLVSAHAAALERAPALGFAKYVASATTPFHPGDAGELATDAASVIARRCDPSTAEVFGERGWILPRSIDRVYDNTRARQALGWNPVFDFDSAVRRIASGEHPLSDLAQAIGSKGYGSR